MLLVQEVFAAESPPPDEHPVRARAAAAAKPAAERSGAFMMVSSSRGSQPPRPRGGEARVLRGGGLAREAAGSQRPFESPLIRPVSLWSDLPSRAGNQLAAPIYIDVGKRCRRSMPMKYCPCQGGSHNWFLPGPGVRIPWIPAPPRGTVPGSPGGQGRPAGRRPSRSGSSRRCRRSRPCPGRSWKEWAANTVPRRGHRSR